MKAEIYIIKKANKGQTAAGLRAVKTMAQSAVALIPAAATIGAVDWQVVLGTAALAGVVSLLTSLTGLPEVAEENTGN